MELNENGNRVESSGRKKTENIVERKGTEEKKGAGDRNMSREGAKGI
jgi:hypothetical protein